MLREYRLLGRCRVTDPPPEEEVRLAHVPPILGYGGVEKGNIDVTGSMLIRPSSYLPSMSIRGLLKDADLASEPCWEAGNRRLRKTGEDFRVGLSVVAGPATRFLG